MAPRPTRGRRPDAELAALRERIAQLMLQGLRAAAIRRALAGPEAPNPVVISERQVRAHMTAVERSWVARAGPATLEADRAAAGARLEEVMRTALGRSTPWGSETQIRSRRDAVVLVDEPTEQVPPANIERADRDRDGDPWRRRLV